VRFMSVSCSDRPNLSADVVVIGAGIVGAACAYALALRGLAVHLVEREAPARAASGACEGNLVLWDRPTGSDLELARWSHARWAELAGELLEETGLDIEFDRKGSLMLAQDEDAAEAARERCAWLTEQRVVLEWLDETALHEAEPALARDVPAAAYFPLDAQIEPRIATAALVASAQRRGAVVHLHEPVVSLAADGAGTCVATDRHAIAAPHAVVAAGVWSPHVLGDLARLPITARKGQIAVVAGEIDIRHKSMEAGYVRTVSNDETGLQVATVVESTKSGSILLGSSRLGTTPDDRGVDVAVLGQIVARAVRFFPGLASMRLIRSYAGLRPMSPDHTPVVGPLPEHPAVLVATGHEGGGVMMAAATGELIARRITSEPLPVSGDPYLPSRFTASSEASR
jgi:D-hydroxyproline dehydrogenase subunit beta